MRPCSPPGLLASLDGGPGRPPRLRTGGESSTTSLRGPAGSTAAKRSPACLALVSNPDSPAS